MSWKTWLSALAAAVWLLVPRASWAAGTLKDAQSGAYAEIRNHQVRVLLNNGFARTEVTQVFRNPGNGPLDAIYEFPIPENAALSQLKIELADRTLNGEVLPREQAQQIYDNQKQSGGQAGLATKDGHQNFRFSIANIPAQSDAVMSFVYYEPVNVEDSLGRYSYPLEDGGTAGQPWSGNTEANAFHFELELQSAVPLQSVTMPHYAPQVEQLGEGHYKVSLDAAPVSLTQDVVVNYQFDPEMPRRMDVLRHRPQSGGLGTFMMVYTPGVALSEITYGTDYVFVLDVSGSMAGKLGALAAAVTGSLQKLSSLDRFRVVAFNTQTWDVSGGMLPATADNVAMVSQKVLSLQANEGTDLHAGLSLGLDGINADRVTNTILVTDAETNTGIIEPTAFDSLARKHDVRIFGMLMGNNANWPLMQVIGEASGGFYAQVSNKDDIEGRVQLVFERAKHEALHDVKLEVSGAGISDVTDFRLSKIYKGQQLVLFGRYATPGNVELTLHAKTMAKTHDISQSAHLPEVDLDNAVIERLWALDMVHALERQALLGLISQAEAKAKIVELGVKYQLVTDYTAMIAVDDATFEQLGVERTNDDRIDAENGYGSGSGSGYTGTTYGGAVDGVHLGMLAMLLIGLGLVGAASRQRKEAS